MQVEIITPDKQVYNGEANSIVVPGVDGSMGILNNHAPMITALKAGAIKVTNGASVEAFPIKGGVLEVMSNKVIILAD